MVEAGSHPTPHLPKHTSALHQSSTELQQVDLVWISVTAWGEFPLKEPLLPPMESQGHGADVGAPLGVAFMEQQNVSLEDKKFMFKVSGQDFFLLNPRLSC